MSNQLTMSEARQQRMAQRRAREEAERAAVVEQVRFVYAAAEAAGWEPDWSHNGEERGNFRCRLRGGVEGTVCEWVTVYVRMRGRDYGVCVEASTKPDNAAKSVTYTTGAMGMKAGDRLRETRKAMQERVDFRVKQSDWRTADREKFRHTFGCSDGESFEMNFGKVALSGERTARWGDARDHRVTLRGLTREQFEAVVSVLRPEGEGA